MLMMMIAWLRSRFRCRSRMDFLFTALTLIHAAAQTHFNLKRKHKSLICTSTEIIFHLIPPGTDQLLLPLWFLSVLYQCLWMQSDTSLRQRTLQSASTSTISPLDDIMEQQWTEPMHSDLQMDWERLCRKWLDATSCSQQLVRTQ